MQLLCRRRHLLYGNAGRCRVPGTFGCMTTETMKDMIYTLERQTHKHTDEKDITKTSACNVRLRENDRPLQRKKMTNHKFGSV